MKPVQVVVAFLVGCALVGSVDVAEAQSLYLDRPTLSPYLHLFRSDPGPLGQYRSWVRPRQELQRAMTGQRAAIRGQQRSIQGLQGEMSRFGTTGPTRATGTGSTFMNYSHYYSGFGGARSSGGSRRNYTPSRGYSGSYGGSSGSYGGY